MPAPLPTTGGLLGSGGGVGGFVGAASTNGNGASHVRGAPSNGTEDFTDFQGSSATAAPVAGGEGCVMNAVPGAATAFSGGAGARSGVPLTNAKWRDVSSLVDLGGLSSNTDKKVCVRLLGCKPQPGYGTVGVVVGVVVVRVVVVGVVIPRLVVFYIAGVVSSYKQRNLIFSSFLWLFDFVVLCLAFLSIAINRLYAMIYLFFKGGGGEGDPAITCHVRVLL